MNTIILDRLSIGAIISGVIVITTNNPVISVLFLISVFINSAGYILILGINFVGISYLIVYVGAIAILFLFVVMILNIQLTEIVLVGREYTKNIPLGYIVRIIFFIEIVSIIPISNRGEIILNIINRINIKILGINDRLSNSEVHIIFKQHNRDIYIEFDQIQAIGHSLYMYGSIWLLLTSIILLLAILGPIRLCLRSTNK